MIQPKNSVIPELSTRLTGELPIKSFNTMIMLIIQIWIISIIPIKEIIQLLELFDKIISNQIMDGVLVTIALKYIFALLH